jgi:hypothetical protein
VQTIYRPVYIHDHPHSSSFITSFKTEYSRPISEIPSFISHSSTLVILYIFTSSQLTSMEPTCHTLPFSFPRPSQGPTQPHWPPIPRTDASHPLLLRRPPPPLPCFLRRWPTSPVSQRTKRRRRSRPWRCGWIQALESKATTGPGWRGALSSVRVGLLRGGGGGAASSSVRWSMGHGGTLLLLHHHRRCSSRGGVERHAPRAVGASTGARSGGGGDGSTDDCRGAPRCASPPSPRWEHVRPRPSGSSARWWKSRDGVPLFCPCRCAARRG